MKKTKTERSHASDEMLPEYDFAGKKGIRGKYYRAYRQGHTVKVYKANGTVATQHFDPAEETIVLEPEIRKYFPNSEIVNATLRSLIALIPQKTETRKPFKKQPAKKADSSTTRRL